MPLSNYTWRFKHPDASVLHLPMINSDHSPILFNLEKSTRKMRSPFRIEAMWFTDESFKNDVDQAWNKVLEQPITEKIRHCKGDIKHWSKQKFGNI